MLILLGKDDCAHVQSQNVMYPIAVRPCNKLDIVSNELLHCSVGHGSPGLGVMQNDSIALLGLGTLRRQRPDHSCLHFLPHPPLPPPATTNGTASYAATSAMFLPESYVTQRQSADSPDSRKRGRHD